MASQEIDAVVFDLGGVLIDWDPRFLYRQLFADRSEMEDFLARICTPDWHRAHDLGEDITASCERLALLHPGHRDMIMAWAERGDEMAVGQIDETVEVLRELTAAGTRCYALSNMEPQMFTIRRARFPFMSWFDDHVISGIEGVAKPDRRIFEILLERHGLRPQSTVFIDDHTPNIVAAQELGITAIQYTSPQRLRQDLHILGLTPMNPT
jgi:2-haloacid dehalogenase